MFPCQKPPATPCLHITRLSWQNCLLRCCQLHTQTCTTSFLQQNACCTERNWHCYTVYVYRVLSGKQLSVCNVLVVDGDTGQQETVRNVCYSVTADRDPGRQENTSNSRLPTGDAQEDGAESLSQIQQAGWFTRNQAKRKSRGQAGSVTGNPNDE